MANRVAELSTTIAENTAKVNAYLTTYGISPLSFDADVPSHVQVDTTYTEPRDAAIQACSELQALLGGSTRSIFTSNVSVQQCFLLLLLFEFNVILFFNGTKITSSIYRRQS